MAFETFEISHGIEESKPNILPPLRTLNLPFITSRPSHDNLPYNQHNTPRNHSRRISTSSSCTSPGTSSRTTSPSPSDTSSFSSLRLEPCTLDEADAVILIPPPSTTTTTTKPESANSAKPTTTNSMSSPSNKPLFLVGPALHNFRLRRPPSSRPLAKGARVHPYRIVPNYSTTQSHHNNGPRRRSSSTVSFTGLTHVRLPLQDLQL